MEEGGESEEPVTPSDLSEEIEDDPPVPPPPAIPPPGDDASERPSSAGRTSRGPRAPKMVQPKVVYPHGYITWLHVTDCFIARCSYESGAVPEDKHIRCTKTCTCHSGAKAGQGRSLGYLAWWLENAHLYDGQPAHNKAIVPAWQARREARDRFKLMPNSAALLAIERPRNERLEPDSEPDAFKN